MGLFDKLFKPQWMSEIEHQAKQAVTEVDDPETLRRIMTEAPTTGARVAAMVKLDDQALFREIALASEDADLAYEAALRVDDVTTLESAVNRENLWDYLSTRVVKRNIVLKRLLSLTKASLDAVRADVPAMDDAARLVELAISDPAHDVPVCPRSVRDSEPYSLLQVSARFLRQEAVDRLAELGDDNALVEVAKHAADDRIVERAISSIRDKNVLDRIALDSDLSYGVRRHAIAHTNNADLLRGLVEKMDPDAARLSDAVRRLAELPCTDGEAHEWVTISEEDNSALGLYSEGPRSIDWVKRCRKCGIELEGSSRVGIW